MSVGVEHGDSELPTKSGKKGGKLLLINPHYPHDYTHMHMHVEDVHIFSLVLPWHSSVLSHHIPSAVFPN